MMLALQRSRLCPGEYATAYQHTLNVDKENCVLSSSVEREQPGNHELRKNNVYGERDLKKVSLLKVMSRPQRFKSTGGGLQKAFRDDEPLSESKILLQEDASVRLMFPEFFPRDKMLCYHADFETPHQIKADPILCSWMLLFGHQTTK